MAEKSMQDLEREKIEWEIRALKRRSRPQGYWLGLLLLLNLAAIIYGASRWAGYFGDAAQSRELEVQRKLLALETQASEVALREFELARRTSELEENENKVLRAAAQSSETQREIEVRIQELERQLADYRTKLDECHALADKTWDQRVTLLESLNRIEEVWKVLPESLTFTQLRDLRPVEEELTGMRTILEDIEAPK